MPDHQPPPETSRDKAGVFVSYAREDAAIVDRLAAALRASGREVWIDTDHIRGTEEWARAVDAGIEASDAVAFVLSPPFLDSEQCRRELEHAVRNGKRLVPLLAREVDSGAVPPELARLNWINVGGDEAASARSLEEALDTDLDWVRAHTDLLVRAVAWEARSEDRGLLLRGRPLADAEGFLATAAGKDPPPAPLQVRYVLAGRHAATRRQRATIAVVTTFLIVAVALGIVALVQRNRAIHQANIAWSRQLASSSNAIAESDPELARLLAIEAMDREETPEAVAVLRRVVAQPALGIHTASDAAVVALSSDGRRVAVRAPNNTLEVLDVESGRRVASSMERVSATGTVALAANGGVLAATNAGGAILWDIEDDRRSRVRGRFSALRFSPDGSKLLLVEHTGSIAIVDIRRPERRVTLPARAGDSSVFPGAPTATFAPRAEQVVTWNEEALEARIWDARTGALQSRLRHGAGITAAGISQDGDLALTAGRDMTVRFWDTGTGAETRRPITVPSADNDDFDLDIAAASFSPQSSAFVTTLTQDHIHVWRTSDAKLQLSLVNRFDYLLEQGFGPKDPYLLTGSGIRDWVHNRKVVDPPMGVTLVHEDGSFDSVERLGDQSTRVWSGLTESTLVDFGRRAADVSSAGGLVAVGYTDGTAEVRRARGARTLLRVPGKRREQVGVELSGDGRRLAVERGSGVEVWDLRAGERRTLDPSISAAIAFSADGSRLLVFRSTGAGAFDVIDTGTGAPTGKTFPPRTTLIRAAALSPDGRLFVRPTADHTIDVFRVVDGVRVGQPLRGHSNQAAHLAVSPDNTLVASGGFDGAVIIWDIDNSRRVATLRAHDGVVTRVLFSPDGRWLLTRSTDGTLRVWEARTGAPVAAWTDLPALPTPRGIDAPPVADLGLDFSPSGEELLRADESFVYRLPCQACAEPDELLARARLETRRSLTRAERLEYLHEGG